MNGGFQPLTPITARVEWTLEAAVEQVGACPLCREHVLKWDGQVLTCQACGAGFPIQYDIPCMEVGARSNALSREVEWYRKDGETEDLCGRETTQSEGHHSAHGKARRAIARALGDLGATGTWTILSIGCGERIEIPLIQQVSGRIVGIDIALPALRRIRAQFPYRVFQGNVRSLPFRDLAFDACVAYGLLRHISRI